VQWSTKVVYFDIVRIGIDLGGTKTEIIALNLEGGEIHRERRPTPSHSYEEILKNIFELVATAEKKLGITGNVGIGIPGVVSPATGLIKNSNTLCLIGHALDKDLEKILARPIRLANDANCFALSEATDGAGSRAKVVFGVILGTGVGGGIVVDGKVITGANAIAGEWGHNPLPWPNESEWPGPKCYCKRNGCIETFLSGPGMQKEFLTVTGREATSREIVALCEKGDPLAELAIQRYEDRLARALATVVNLIDPDTIVLGGGLSNLSRLYENVPKAWQRYVFSDRVDTHLVPATFGDSSGVRGAAWLWPR
jgi:fructokinase